MPPRSEPDVVARVTAVAAGQLGLIASRQLVQCGASTPTIARWCAAGWLHRVHHGVYAVGHAALTPSAHRLGAVLTSAPDVVLLGYAAFDELGLLTGRARSIEVGSPRTVRQRRARHLGDPFRHRAVPWLAGETTCEVNSIPMPGIGGLLTDLAGRVRPGQIVNLAERATWMLGFDLQELERRAVAHAGSPRGDCLEAALEDLALGGTGEMSGLEALVGDALAKAGVRGLQQNVRHAGASGRRWRLDLCDPVLQLYWEIDGGPHRLPRQQAWDVTKDNDLSRVGWTGRRFLGDEVTDRPDRVVSIVEDDRARARRALLFRP